MPQLLPSIGGLRVRLAVMQEDSAAQVRSRPCSENQASSPRPNLSAETKNTLTPALRNLPEPLSTSRRRSIDGGWADTVGAGKIGDGFAVFPPAAGFLRL